MKQQTTMNDVIIIDCICIEFAVMKLIMNDDDDDDDELMNDNIQAKIVDYFISMVINKKKMNSF